MMDKIKMLNDEQLENVSGGGKYAPADHLPASHGAHINASELLRNKNMYIGRKFYCVLDSNPEIYAIVTLNDVRMGLSFPMEKVTINKIPNKFTNPFTNQYGYEYSVGEECELCSSWYTMYIYEQIVY